MPLELGWGGKREKPRPGPCFVACVALRGHSCLLDPLKDMSPVRGTLNEGGRRARREIEGKKEGWLTVYCMPGFGPGVGQQGQE